MSSYIFDLFSRLISDRIYVLSGGKSFSWGWPVMKIIPGDFRSENGKMRKNERASLISCPDLMRYPDKDERRV